MVEFTRQQLQEMERQIILKELQQRLWGDLKAVQIEPVEGGFWIRNFRKVKQKDADMADYYVPSHCTLIAEAYWVCHPFLDRALNLLTQWLLGDDRT